MPNATFATLSVASARPGTGPRRRTSRTTDPAPPAAPSSDRSHEQHDRDQRDHHGDHVEQEAERLSLGPQGIQHSDTPTSLAVVDQAGQVLREPSVLKDTTDTGRRAGPGHDL